MAFERGLEERLYDHFKNYHDCLTKPYVSEMDFTGKPVKGLIYILPDGFESDSDLMYWVNICISFVDSLPPKQEK
jgi:hypothetical protein